MDRVERGSTRGDRSGTSINSDIGDLSLGETVILINLDKIELSRHFFYHNSMWLK